MGMKMTMGYVSPSAIQAKRNEVRARREAAKRAIDQRVSEGLATLVDAAVAKVKGESPSPEIEEPKEKTPPPFGLNRPGCSKDFAYKFSDGKNIIDKVITLATGDRVPTKHISVYWESKNYFREMLHGFATMGRTTPMCFLIAPREADDKRSGWGAFSRAFIADDPKFLAGDLAHVDALLAARGLCLSFCPWEINRDETDALRYLPSAPAALSAKEPPPFKSEVAVIVEWKADEFGYACTALRHGDRVADHLHDYFHARREKYEKILYGYKRADALSFASPFAGRGAEFFKGYLKEYLDSIIPGREAQPLDFFVYDSAVELRDDAAVTHYASSGPSRTFFAASTAYGGNRFGYVGHGWVPKGITAEQLAHIDCRFAASGLEIRLVPRVEDDLPTDVIDLMWGRA